MSLMWPYPAPPDDGGARHLVKGKPLPELSLPSTSGQPIVLSRCKGTALIFVYPWTGRPGVADPPCWDDIAGAHGSTPEALGFRNLHSGFDAAGIAVFGLSAQEPAWQAEFAERCRLPYALLSDAGLAFQRALRLPTFQTGGVTYLARLTLVVEDGHIVRCIYPVHPPDTHAREMLAMLEAARGYAAESRLRSNSR